MRRSSGRSWLPVAIEAASVKETYLRVAYSSQAASTRWLRLLLLLQQERPTTRRLPAITKLTRIESKVNTAFVAVHQEEESLFLCFIISEHFERPLRVAKPSQKPTASRRLPETFATGASTRYNNIHTITCIYKELFITCVRYTRAKRRRLERYRTSHSVQRSR